MPFFASQQTSNALGLPLSSIEETLRAFDVPFGKPEDLPAFPRRLARDEALQNALAGLIRARQQSSPGGVDALANRLSLHQALDSLLHVVGGAPARDLTANPSLHETVDVLISYLISLDGWSSAELHEAIEPSARESLAFANGTFSPNRAEQNRTEQSSSGHDRLGQNGAGQNRTDGTLEDQIATESGSPELGSPEQIAQEQADEEELARLLKETSALSRGGLGAVDSGAVGSGDVGANGAPALGDLAQLLTRLELNNLELRLQLESIDSRLDRMEPRIESLPRPGAEAAAATGPEAQSATARGRGDKLRYTTAAAFSAIPLGPEPSPFAGGAGASAGQAGAGTGDTGSGSRDAGAGSRPVLDPAAGLTADLAPDALLNRPQIASFTPLRAGSAEWWGSQSGAQFGSPSGAQVGSQTGPAPAPRPAVLRYAVAKSSDPTANSGADDPPRSADTFASVLENAAALAPAPELSPAPLDAEPQPATEGVPALPAGAARAARVSIADPASDVVADPASDVVADPASAVGESSPARSAPVAATLPAAALPTAAAATQTVALPASPGWQLHGREPGSTASAKPGKRSAMTSLGLNDSRAEPPSELRREDARSGRSSDFESGKSSNSDSERVSDSGSDFDEPTPTSDRRRRWRATLIVVFLLLLAAGALAAFLFLGNPETTTFRGAVEAPRPAGQTL